MSLLHRTILVMLTLAIAATGVSVEISQPRYETLPYSVYVGSAEEPEIEITELKDIEREHDAAAISRIIKEEPNYDVGESRRERYHFYSEADVVMLARVVWTEARSCSREEQALVVWTALQRVDSGRFGASIEDVITAPYQFAYSETAPVDEAIYALCHRELELWALGEPPPTLYPYANTLPYYYFEGDGSHNWFRGSY